MENSVIKILESIKIPAMAQVTQFFPGEKIENIADDLERKAGCTDIKILPGMKIAITAGSRGISNIDLITKWVVDYLRARGAEPFIVPAMGSHGGATPEGQIRLLGEYGITQEKMGVPILSSMEVVKLGTLKDGAPVYLDRNAYEADGIVVINRIKLHTAFRGRYESGLVKMLAVGLGKQMGADTYHSKGLDQLGKYVAEAGEYLVNCLNIVMGVAIVENAYEETSRLEILRQEDFLKLEPSLLSESISQMPCIKLKNLDVLIVDAIGKNYSGSGMDPNITGKFINPSIPSDPIAKFIVVLGLSRETDGNGNGIGLADVTTQRVLRQMDYTAMYMNGLTSGVTISSKMPMHYSCDRHSIQAAIKLTKITDLDKLRIVRIPNTLELQKIQISKGLEAEAASCGGVKITSDFIPMKFDNAGNLF